MNATRRIEWLAGLGKGTKLRDRLPAPIRKAWRLCGRRESQALIMCVACLLLYFGAIRPERMLLDEALRQAATLQARRSVIIAPVDSAATELGRFYASFPNQAVFPVALAQLMKTAADHSLSVNEGEYTVTRQTAGRLVRFQIVLPLRGTYPQVRSFIAALARDIPGMALENARFERREIGDPALDVTLRLVVFLVRVP